MIYLIDSHSHFYYEQQQHLNTLLQQTNIIILFSISSPQQDNLAELMTLKETYPTQIYLSLGVHPWHSNKLTLDDLLPYFSYADCIGEIGLDDVWCDVPLSMQQPTFIQHLTLAEKLQKPIILHLKGQEQLAADILSTEQLTVPILVHWYSGDEVPLKQLAQLGCYFSVGPDIQQNQDHRKIFEYVSPERLLTETDGPLAITWAKHDHKTYSFLDIPHEINHEIGIIANQLHLSDDKVKRLIMNNFQAFLMKKNI